MRCSIRRVASAVLGALAALAVPATAAAHATINPPQVKARTLQLYTLAVPTEKEGATTTGIELTVPSGFAIDAFEAAPGWRRTTQTSGSGEAAVVQRVRFTGGRIPAGELAIFRFSATPQAARTYTFGVRQTYSDGSVVVWSGPEGSEAPAPQVDAVSSLGGGSSSTVAIVALATAVLALVIGAIAMLAGRRPLA